MIILQNLQTHSCRDEGSRLIRWAFEHQDGKNPFCPFRQPAFEKWKIHRKLG